MCPSELAAACGTAPTAAAADVQPGVVVPPPTRRGAAPGCVRLVRSAVLAGGAGEACRGWQDRTGHSKAQAPACWPAVGLRTCQRQAAWQPPADGVMQVAYGLAHLSTLAAALLAFPFFRSSFPAWSRQSRCRRCRRQRRSRRSTAQQAARQQQMARMRGSGRRGWERRRWRLWLRRAAWTSNEACTCPA